MVKIKQQKRKEREQLKVSESTIKMCNLSAYSLNGAKMSLLKKGLSFAPSRGPNQFGLFTYLHNVITSLRQNTKH